METYTVMKLSSIDLDEGSTFVMLAHKVAKEELKAILLENPDILINPSKFYIFKNVDVRYTYTFTFQNNLPLEISELEMIVDE